MPNRIQDVRRGGPRLAVLALALLTLARYGDSIEAQSSCGGSINPIACENQKTGDPASQWDVSGAGDATLQGFATDISVNVGGTVRFKVNTTASTFGIDIYRLGYYGGFGARKIASLTNIAGRNQPACLTDAPTGLVDCGNWIESASWVVPTSAVSGIYFAKLTRFDTGGASHIVFVVRDDAGHSDLLFQTSDETWQAYNRYGGNSLYTGQPAGRAYKVSYNRPFTTRDYLPLTFVFDTEYPMVRWLEANGYNVSYFTDVDSDRFGSEILEHKIFLAVGHDEYWSGPQRANVEAARTAGVNLAFFSGNEIFWKTRWENSIDGSGTSYRTLVCYKETHAGAKIDPTPVWTGTWRDSRFSPPADGGRPENALTGNLFMVNGGAYGSSAAMQVPPAEGKTRFWRNTSIATLAQQGGTTTLPSESLGYEWDVDVDNGLRPPGLIHLSSTTVPVGALLADYGSTYVPGVATHTLTLYRHSSALVFGAGTIRWPWGLDATHDGAGPAASTDMKQATVNLFADMGAQPGTLQPGLSPATGSTDLTPPTSTITFPVNGQSFQALTPITISGTAADSGGGIVAGIEVSVDGGSTWQQAAGRENWTFAWTPAVAATKTIMSRAVDDSVNREQPTAGMTVTITPVPQTFIGLNTVGGYLDSGDSNYLNGSKVTTSAGGQIASMSVYVGLIDSSAGNQQYQLAIYTDTAGKPGTLVTASATGTLVANAWNTIAVNASLLASTNYWLVYNTNGRSASVNNMYYNIGGAGQGAFSSSSVAFGTWPATFPASQLSNGVYSLLATFASADTTPPTVTSVAPANGATGVATGTAVTETFSETINVATLTTTTFVLRDPGNAVVPAAVTYNAATRVGTLTPSAALANATTYTATITGGSSGVRDLAGNALAGNIVWSFTTVADTTPPTVTSVTPANGATGVSKSTTITATFSEAISDAALTTSTFVLRDPANAVVPATVSYNAATRVGTLTPSAALSASKTYTATITGGSGGVKDLAGNALASDVVWSFTTASVTVGLTTIGGTLDSGDSGYLNGSKVTTSAGGQIMSMSVYVGNIGAAPNQQYQLAIYTDSAGAPGTLVAASATGTLVANSWNTIAISASLQASTNYWLMFSTNGTTSSVNNMYYNSGSIGQGVYSNGSVTFGTWPATFPAATLTNGVFSLFATFGP